MKRNIFITLIGIETLCVGLALVFQRNLLQDDPNNRLVHAFHHMGDINWSFILIAMGLLATVIGMTNFNRYHAKSIAMIMLSSLWCAYFVTFLLQDIYFPGIIGIKTIMTGFVFIQILVEARYGGDGK
ncbi:hypothetical protein H5R88_07595 [Limosilactobacillus sp. WF-MT5-A]|uniref:hypothetical protein n=1 Tax=Limosilactobacillus agrestis TaxID=2759748 RepID=UPI0015F996E0|nr:hypothetical protein [Limosilactobacillus agrestis]MBB1099959.1 hypothetical protein [Limosilactobacillus agrestis]MCD7113418.1 hypothetical protein [Limosilactobacillus agrestis]MCD7127359.1 hypothetical protein [Limosilactobacillus agrestis]